jgi:tetratricopeptide (TPR) repeat protein
MERFIQTAKMAIQQERSKDYTRAFNTYNLAVELTRNPYTIIKIRSKQAWCLHHVGNPLETEKIFTKLIEDYSNHAWSFLLYAKYLIKTKRFKSARTLLQKSSENFPNNLEIYLTLASLLKDMERSNESITVLKTALSKEHLTNGRGIRRKDIWAELGNLFFQRGDYNSAISALKKSLRMDTDENFLHYDILSICYLLVGDPENALYFLENYTKFYGELDPELLIIKARSHSRIKDFPNACAALLQAYSYEDRLTLDADDLFDLAPLKQLGFLETLENIEIED